MKLIEWLTEHYYYLIGIIAAFLLIIVIGVVVFVRKSSFNVKKSTETKPIKKEIGPETRQPQRIDPKDASKRERIMQKLPSPPNFIYEKLPTNEQMAEQAKKKLIYDELPPENLTPKSPQKIIYEKLPDVTLKADDYYAQDAKAQLGVPLLPK